MPRDIYLSPLYEGHKYIVRMTNKRWKFIDETWNTSEEDYPTYDAALRAFKAYVKHLNS